MASEPRQGLREGSHGLFLSTVGRQKKAWLPQPWRALLSAAQGGRGWSSLEPRVGWVGKVVGCGAQGGWDGIGKRVVFLAFPGLWFSHTRAWDLVERERRLMGVPS